MRVINSTFEFGYYFEPSKVNLKFIKEMFGHMNFLFLYTGY